MVEEKEQVAWPVTTSLTSYFSTVLSAISQLGLVT
jgi:hypothetical protein